MNPLIEKGLFMIRGNDISLNGQWLFKPDADNSGEAQCFYRDDLPVKLWHEIQVPSVFETSLKELHNYPGVCWYRKVFDFPRLDDSSSCWLWLEGVLFEADVWLNEEHIGKNSLGYLPFAFDISSVLKSGSNILVVRVNAARHPGYLPPNHFWRHHGGLFRDVFIEQRPPVFTECTYINADYLRSGQGKLSISLDSKTTFKTDIHARVSVSVWDDIVKVGQAESLYFKLSDEGSVATQINCEIDSVTCWDPDNPHRYQLVIQVTDGKEILFESKKMIGFRHIEVSDGKIYLNFQPIFLNGVNRHEESPRTLMAVDRDNSKSDFEMIKKAGANFVRMCHYPHDSFELDYCDRIGLLVLAEIPLNAYMFPFPFTDDERLLQALPSVEEQARTALFNMIKRDAVHPSVIIWSVSNETGEHVKDVRDLNSRLIQYAQYIDSSRLVVHVSLNATMTGEHMVSAYQFDDMICVNSYQYCDELRKNNQLDQEALNQFWQHHVNQLRQYYPDKPIVLTEYGFPLILENNQDDEEALQQKYLDLVAKAAVKYLAGCAIWAWADHDWPLIWPQMDTMFGNSLSTFGLVTKDRQHVRKAIEILRKINQRL